jgi:hypothetical protein
MGMASRYRLGVHNNSLTNVLRGLKERVYNVERGGELAPPPRPGAGVFERLENFRRQLAGRVGRANPWSYEEFILSCRGSKRALYQRAVESLLQTPLSRGDAKLSTFVKAEKLDLESKPDPAPRLIQPRSPRYNAWVGRYLKAIEHRIYEGIDGIWGEVTVMSGYNALDVARHLRRHWDQWHDTVAIGLDASRFDQHVSADALRWEHSVYNDVYQDPVLAEVLKWQIANRGVARTAEGDVDYEVEGCRMSGDMNTSLGNKLIMCALVWTYCQELGIPASLANNGDDCVLFVRRRHAQKVSTTLSGWFTEFGFTMKVEPAVDVFEQIEFCQQRPVWVEEAWLMTRSPYKGLAKDMMMLGVDAGRAWPDYASWASGVGRAGLAAYGGVPVVQEVYRWMAGLASGKMRLDPYSGLGTASRGMIRSYHEPGPECRASYWLAWGITPVAQAAIEAAIRAVVVERNRLYSIPEVDHLSITY